MIPGNTTTLKAIEGSALIACVNNWLVTIPAKDLLRLTQYIRFAQDYFNANSAELPLEFWRISGELGLTREDDE